MKIESGNDRKEIVTTANPPPLAPRPIPEQSVDLTQASLSARNLLTVDHHGSPSPSTSPDRLVSPRTTENEPHASDAGSTHAPTKSWAYRWLGFGLVAGGCAAVGGIVATTGLAGSWLASQGHYLLLALIAVHAIFRTKLELNAWGYVAQTPGEVPGDLASQLRVQDAVTELSMLRGSEPPRIIPTTRIDNLGIASLSRQDQLLFYNPDFVRTLTDQELRSLVAHELCHVQPLVGELKFIMRRGLPIAASSLGCAAVTLCLDQGQSIVGSLGLGCAAAWALTLVLGQVIGIARRADELCTDIRSVELTGDSTSLLAALNRAYQDLYAKTPKCLHPLASFGSHPSLPMRERWIRRAVGEFQQGSS